MSKRIAKAVFAVLFSALLPSLWGVAEAAPARKAAVFPFEVPDVIEQGEFLPKPSKEGPKIALATDELRKLLAASGRYEVIDLAALATEIKAAQPLHKCNGCEADLAKKAGADVLVVGLVEKASDVLLNMTIEIRDVASGKAERVGSIVVQGNTDDMWLRSVRWLSEIGCFQRRRDDHCRAVVLDRVAVGVCFRGDGCAKDGDLPVRVDRRQPGGRGQRNTRRSNETASAHHRRAEKARGREWPLRARRSDTNHAADPRKAAALQVQRL